METSSLHTLLLVEEKNRSDVLDRIKQIQEKLRQVTTGYQVIRSRYQIIMFDWILFTIEGISWNLGIQLQEVVEELEVPTLFVSSGGSDLTDISQLNNGKFDRYFRDLLDDTDKLQEFIMHFLSFTKIIDYCLLIWKNQISMITDELTLEEMEYHIDYTPLKSIIRERIQELDPWRDEKQRSLEDFF